MDKPFPAYRGNEPYVFVSYAHDDSMLAYPEMARMHARGFNVWYDEGLSPGVSWRQELADAISRASVLVYLVTARSAQSSNCHKEVSYASTHCLSNRVVRLKLVHNRNASALQQIKSCPIESKLHIEA